LIRNYYFLALSSVCSYGCSNARADGLATGPELRDSSTDICCALLNIVTRDTGMFLGCTGLVLIVATLQPLLALIRTFVEFGEFHPFTAPHTLRRKFTA
jgi:hypothetical protein